MKMQDELTDGLTVSDLVLQLQQLQDSLVECLSQPPRPPIRLN